MKTRQNNYVTNRIGLVYVENNNELLRPIRPGVVYSKTRWDNDVTDLPNLVYVENKTELL